MSKVIRERIRIYLETYDMSSAELIHVLVPGLPVVEKGDKLQVTYDLHFDYMQEVWNRLTAIEKLLANPKVVGRADMVNLNGNRILLQDIIRKIDNIQSMLK